MSDTKQPSTAPDKGGKYLTFALGGEEYGLPILKAREIIGWMDITPVPRLPAFVLGVINLRGQVIPVIDLRAKFGMPAAVRNVESCIVVAEMLQDGRRVNTGLVVDRVSDVVNIAADQIDEPPDFGAAVRCDFLLGMGKVAGRVKILLDIDRVLSTGEVVSLSHLPANQAA